MYLDLVGKRLDPEQTGRQTDKQTDWSEIITCSYPSFGLDICRICSIALKMA